MNNLPSTSKKYLEKGRCFICVIAPLDLIWPLPNKFFFDKFVEYFGTPEDIWPPTINWIAPENYRNESGTGLSTLVFVLRGAYKLNKIKEIKTKALQLEDDFKKFGKRKFNINPGFINSSFMCLASHKPSFYRWKLSENVWIEEQMHTKNGLLHTYHYAFDEFSCPDRISRLEILQQSLNHTVTSSPFIFDMKLFQIKALSGRLFANQLAT